MTVMDHVSGLVDRMTLIAAMLAGIAATIHLLDIWAGESPVLDLTFLYVDLAAIGVLGASYTIRHRLPTWGRIGALGLVVWPIIVLSLVRHGLVSIGIVLICTFIVVSLVALAPRPGRIVAASSVSVVFLFALLVHREIVVYPDSTIARQNQGLIWLIVGVGLVAFVLICGAVIDSFRTRLLAEISSLEKSNANLVTANRELSDSRERARKLAYLDKLTGVPNRHSFRQHVVGRIAAGVPSGYLALLDIRGFRVINALYGSERGDSILTKVSHLLQQGLTDHQFLARLGGDEFALWIEDHDEVGVVRGFAAFMQSLLWELPPEELGHRVEFFQGVAHYPGDGTNYQECLRYAGIALRRAKDMQSTDTVMFASEMLAEVEAEHRMRRLLERAIEKREFAIAYQKKIDLDTRRVVAVEALARWSPPELGPVSPEVFVPLITRSVLTESFGKVIIETVLSQFSAIQRTYGFQTSVAINVSPSFFLFPGFPEYLEHAVHSFRVEPSFVTIEITEEVFIDDITKVRAVIRQLRDVGISVSLDDFGKGYSSLYYLSHIDINELKIDKSFIESIATNQRSFGLVETILAIADRFGLQVVAEGVEMAEQERRLREIGCRLVQGFYYSRPEILHPVSVGVG